VTPEGGPYNTAACTTTHRGREHVLSSIHSIFASSAHAFWLLTVHSIRTRISAPFILVSKLQFFCARTPFSSDSISQQPEVCFLQTWRLSTAFTLGLVIRTPVQRTYHSVALSTSLGPWQRTCVCTTHLQEFMIAEALHHSATTDTRLLYYHSLVCHHSHSLARLLLLS
jgi:hypothetical protein